MNNVCVVDVSELMAKIQQNAISVLRGRLEEDFGNGNLKHTFNPEFVDNNKYIETFLEIFEKEMNSHAKVGLD